MATADEWLRRIARLRVDHSTGNPAPHKPLLLLVLLDLAGEGGLPDDALRLTPELVFRFCAYWPVVAQRRRRGPDVRLPFHHLQSDGCWTALTADGQPSHHERTTTQVKFDADFRQLLGDVEWCRQAKETIIRTYFLPDEVLALCEIQGIEPPALVGTDGPGEAERSAARERGREARFRVGVVTAYRYTCALTGYRLMTVSAGTIVDAAHIHRFSDSHNNDIRNGLALSKNAHWLFDNGLWSVLPDFRVIVAEGHFDEDGPDGLLLQRYHDSLLRLPDDERLRPDLDRLEWHRREVFLGVADDS